jgi:hypothetical protein
VAHSRHASGGAFDFDQGTIAPIQLFCFSNHGCCATAFFIVVCRAEQDPQRRYPMTTLSNFQNHDTSGQEAWKQTTLALGALTALAVIAIMIFASTA